MLRAGNRAGFRSDSSRESLKIGLRSAERLAGGHEMRAHCSQGYQETKVKRASAQLDRGAHDFVFLIIILGSARCHS